MTDRLNSILELPESSSEEIEKNKVPNDQRNLIITETMTARARKKSTRNKLLITNNSSTSSNDSDPIINLDSRLGRSRLRKRRNTIGLIWQENGRKTFHKRDTSKRINLKFQEMTANTENPKRSKVNDSKQPCDTFRIAGKFLNKAAGRLQVSRLSNSKTTSVERKNILQSSRLFKENRRVTKEQMETLRIVSKLSILLLYVHFLLTYYLSFAKYHRHGQIFNSCPTEDVQD